MRKILVTQSAMPTLEEYVDEIKDMWESHWLTNRGEKHERLERELEKFLKVEHISLLANGHLALESVLQAMELKGEVITTPFTFVSTTHAIIRSGLKPVFCDIEDNNYTIDAEKIESLITPQTCAILPVHVYGHCCDVKKIEQIAKKHKLKVIYDAAHAFGVRKENRSVATFGDASIYSFHATKVFHTIEGGAIAYAKDELEQLIHHIRNFGFVNEEVVKYVGGNAKMNEFQAAMGICNLRHIGEDIEKRKRLYERYIELLRETPQLKVWLPKEDEEYNYSYFPVLFLEGTQVRDAVKEKLAKEGIYTRKYFYPLVTEYECYHGQFDTKDTPIAERIANQVLTLPLYSELGLDSVEEICGLLKENL